MISKRTGLFGLIVAAAISGPAAVAEEEGDAHGVGEAAWLEHCTVCHGRDGTGNGPFAPMLKTPPADLTRLAERNGGDFPAAKVRAVIDGRRIPIAHGTAEMPIWGKVWSDAGEREIGVRARIIDVVAYLRTIQK
ncbi:MAG: c-type cytochrome [Gammaproteobacteria bacterium]|nr:c-type cytochrome [Gammaproteobacteria bacterium]